MYYYIIIEYIMYITYVIILFNKLFVILQILEFVFLYLVFYLISINYYNVNNLQISIINYII